MVSNYAQYIKERENRDIIETENGFLSYRITEDECLVCDVFIKPELRRTGAIRYFSDEIVRIAKEKGCRYLAGKIYLTGAYATETLLHNLKWGFKLHSVEKECIVLVKYI